MTRGKYAAKANGQRADAAEHTVVALRGQLDQVRRERAVEVAALKAEISSLQGRLLNEVQALAAAEVQYVRSEAQARVDAERADRHEAGLQIARLLGSGDVSLPERSDWSRLAALLDLQVGEFYEAAGLAETRTARRQTAKRMRHVDSLLARGMTLEQIDAGPPGTGR